MQTTVSTHNTRLAPFLGLAALLHAVVLLIPLQHAPAPLLNELRLALAQAGAAPAASQQPPQPRSRPRAASSLPAPQEGSAPSAEEPGRAPAASPTAATATPGADSARVIAQVHAALARSFVYPMAARRQGWQGEVVVAFQVTREGRIDNVEVVRSSGYRLLDEAARSSLAHVGTLPDYTSDEPLQLRMPVVYRLEG